MQSRRNRFVNRPMCIHRLLENQCSLCNAAPRPAAKQAPPPPPEVSKRDAAMWAAHLENALSRAKQWGPEAAALRKQIRRALTSAHIKDLREAGRAYDAFRAESPNAKGRTARKTAPFLPPEAPPGCGVRRQDKWGPTGSWIISGGRAESKRERH